MSRRRETLGFALILASLLGLSLGKSLFGGWILSSADVLFASTSFEEVQAPNYEPLNRLMIDPVLQFQPWLAFNREAFRTGRLPLWNPYSGCGAPLLANAQSAPFDPFHLIAYAGTLPGAYAWMAFARLFTAGLGMFLLADAWKLGGWGRWFSGLVFPLTGFLTVWLSFPVTSAAVWLPWLVLAVHRAVERPGLRRAGQLAVVTGFTILAGHIQTSAHVMLAAGLYGLWMLLTDRSVARRQAVKTGLLGLTLGLGIGAITILPLALYLTKSPVWEARRGEFRSPWVVDRPRALDAFCTAIPYLYGSQRREHPNLAKGLGVHNLNESAGGFAGLATLILLAPLAWPARRSVCAVRFILPLTVFGFLGAFRFSPFSNLLRLLPVLDVTDHRRLTLWVAFGLSILGGVGLGNLQRDWSTKLFRTWLIAVTSGVVLCLGLAYTVARSEPLLTSRALAHYSKTMDRDESASRSRALHQVAKTLDFIPKQLTAVALELSVLASLVVLLRLGTLPVATVRACLLLMTLAELFAFGHGMNPSIPKALDLPVTSLIHYLKDRVGEKGRILGIGEELVPNTLMRYGLSDIRNYDSIELSRSLSAFPDLYQPERRGTTSRGTIAWSNVVASREALEEAGVLAVVGATPPPADWNVPVDRVGKIHIVRLNGKPLVDSVSGDMRMTSRSNHNVVDIETDSDREDALILRTTFDEGWKAEVDDHDVKIRPYHGVFMSVEVPKGKHRLIMTYRPVEVVVALWLSLASVAISLACLGFRPDFSVVPLDGLESSG